jgi:hypothetical protein
MQGGASGARGLRRRPGAAWSSARGAVLGAVEVAVGVPGRLGEGSEGRSGSALGRDRERGEREQRRAQNQGVAATWRIRSGAATPSSWAPSGL